MENKFVKTKNFKNFVSLASKLKNLPDNIPRLALLYSEPGIGKTHRSFQRKLERLVPVGAIYIARKGKSAYNRKYGKFIDRDYSNINCGEVYPYTAD